MSEPPIPKKIRFGAFEVHVNTGELRKHGIRIKLHDQPFKVLCLLLERPGEVISREELCRALWQEGTFVDAELGLNSAVMRLRDAIGESATNPRFIETLPRRGYRFTGPVEKDDEQRCGPEEVSPQLGAHVAPKERNKDQGKRTGWWVAAALCAVLVSFLAWRTAPHLSPASERLVQSAPGLSRLTHVGDCYNAEISPNGEFVAYVRASGGNQSLWLRQVATSNDRELIEAHEREYWGVTFSRDGAYIYYVVSETAGSRRSSVTASLYRIPLIGGRSEKIKDDLDSPISFSPDGKSYTFIREIQKDHQSVLMVASSEDGTERRIASRRLPDIFDFPKWSPDGTTIAVVAAGYSVKDKIAFWGADGAESKTTSLSSKEWGHIYGLDWQGTGHTILVAAKEAPEEGDFQLWEVSHPQGEVRRLTNDLNGYFRVSATKDSRRLVTIQESMLQSLWVASRGTDDKAVQITFGAEHYDGIRWAGENDIVYASDANGKFKIGRIDAAGNGRRQLTSGPNVDRAPVMTEDSKEIFYISCGGHHRDCDIWKVGRDGGEVKRITIGADAIDVDITPDGKWLVYSAPSGTHWSTIWKIPAEGGQPEQLSAELTRMPAVSPDGKWVACFYTKGQGDSQVERAIIAVIPLSGGTPFKTFPLPSTANQAAGLQWIKGGSAVAYIDDGPHNSNVWGQPINGGKPKQITGFRGDRVEQFAWSRSGKEFVYRRDVVSRDVLMLEWIKGLE